MPAEAPTARRPVRGGLNRTFLTIELRRLLRNRRTVVLALIMPPAFFLIFGTQGDYRTTSVGHGNVTAWIMVSMAVYGAMLASASGGAMVSVERALGWSRQLRLTPLRPVAYILTKIVVAMVLGLASVVVVFAVGVVAGAQADASVWVTSALIAWLGSSVFAAFGLFLGYLLPAENVMQMLGPVLAILAFAGGLFVPLTDGLFATIARFTPLYGLAELARTPLVGGGWSWVAVANLGAWAVVFVTGAAVMFRRDTARV
ncbi:hypothetical protein DDP54_13275 [Cellulomonas sp. WB94]|nr:hypothetical protein DDP54_13275 [Cellulomonas sp. WB94]